MANAISRVLRRSALLNQLMSLEGNAKWCVLCEPFWAITNALYVAYAVEYRKAIIGLDNANLGTLLGLLVTIQLAAQFISSFLGGVITDKLGRRRTCYYFDLLSGALSVLLLACAQNFWWFAAAMAFSGCWQINTNAWNGLLTEDCPPKKIPYAFSGITMVQLAATFLTPISIILVRQFDIIPALRGVYLFAFLSQAFKCTLLFLKAKETEQGKKRMAETRKTPFYRMFTGYGRVVGLIFSTPVTRLLLILVITIGINNIIINTFFYDFATERLGLPTASLGYIPMIRAAVCLLFMFTAQSKINEKSHKAVLSIGLALYAIAFACPLLFQGASWLGAVLYIFFEAIANAFVIPRKESLLFLYVDKKERARVYAMLHVIALAITSPFGAVLGAMSDRNRLYPFLFAILVSLGCSILVFRSRAESKHTGATAAE
ncbi:MAG: MFS transporter [Oscillospiraceae bacterium]|nr:MFS transporter [Oscillospiraceae bacterium]